MKRAEGFRGAPSRRWRIAQEMLRRAGVYAYRDRRARKRDFRGLWITRLTAACKMRGINYSRFIHGLIEADVELNRKVLSEMAIHDPAGFDAIVELAKKYQPKRAVA
jgi:large subunit ribosomal protein L20